LDLHESAHLYKLLRVCVGKRTCLPLEPLAYAVLKMAIYHLRVSMISRSTGRSATAASAYRVAKYIEDRRTGLVFDYARRGGVEHTEILAPDDAPDWAYDTSELWNRVEEAETRKNSQVAREVRVALPCELSFEQRVALVRGFCQSQFVDRGMVAEIALHEPGDAGDDRNHHAHIMLTTREIEAEGFTVKNRGWNAVELLEDWREVWALDCNGALERNGVTERIDHRTLQAQCEEAFERAQEAYERGDDRTALELTVQALALDRAPLPQLSAGAWQMKERGEDVEAIHDWRRIKAAAHEIKGAALELAGQVRDWVEQSVTHVKSLAERVREAAQGMDLSDYSARALEVVQGFKAEDRADAQEAKEHRQQQLEQKRQEGERLDYDKGLSL